MPAEQAPSSSVRLYPGLPMTSFVIAHQATAAELTIVSRLDGAQDFGPALRETFPLED